VGKKDVYIYIYILQYLICKYIFKVNIYILIMEKSNKYTKDELKDIFDLVNSKYLHLKGRQMTLTKNQFVNVWKQDNKSLSAFDLMIALYNAETINDKDNEFVQQYMEDNAMCIDEVKNKKPVPYYKYIRRLRIKDHEIDELETKIENMMEDNDLMRIDDHNTEMKELKNKAKLELSEKDDEIEKLQSKLKFNNSDNDAKVSRLQKELEYYKTEIAKLTAD
jgi:hypothetical protein